MNAEVTLATAKPRIQNIETINVDGKFTTTGIDLLSISGTNNLNVNTAILGGTATVINAASINAKNINAGANISTLNVTATASGTRDTVNVDGGSATVKLGGEAALDSFNATTTGNVVLGAVDAGAKAFTAIDSVTLNLSDAATTITGDGKLGALTINQTGVASVITIAGAELTANMATTATAKTTITGDQDVTLKVGTLSFINDTALVNNGTGTVTVKLDVDATAADLSDVVADVIQFNAATAAGTVITNTNSTVKLTEDMNSAMVFDQAAATAAADTALAAGASTLVMEVAHNQSSSTATGAAVGSLILNAGVDSTVTDGSDITIADLTLHANTNTVVIRGAEDLKLTALSNKGDEVISASEMTGKLTITTVDAASTMVLGSGNDVIGTVGGNTVAGAHTIHAGAGDDTITFGALAATGTINGDAGNDIIDVTGAAAQTINGGTGNDTITGSANVDTIDGGAGDDVINGGAGADKITLGAGNDTVSITNGEGGDVIADFVAGEDKLILLGTGNATSLNLAVMTVASGVYSAGTNHGFTLTGSTATDLSGMVQLGKQAVGTTAAVTYTAAAGANIVAGLFNDHITQSATGTLTLNAGAGDDVIVTTGANAATLTGGAGNDTFTVGATSTALVNIKDLSSGDILTVGAGDTNVTAAVVTDYVATAASMQSSTGTIADVVLTLNDGINIDMTLATITGSLGYTISTISTATVGSTIVGSRSVDTLNGSNFADTITGGEGADTITGGAGADTIILTESVSAIDTVVVAAQTIAEGLDTIVDFRGGVDILKTGITPATAAFTDMTGTTLSTTSYATLALAAQAAVDAAQAALDGNYKSAGDAITFSYASDTYLLVNAGTDSKFDDGSDVLVKLVGLDGTLVIGDIIA